MMVGVSFDGACWPNPGGRAGYGWQAYEETPDGPQFLAEGFGPVNGQTSNNVAEWTALARALEWASKQKIGYLTIRGDSKLVINQLRGTYQCKAQHLAPFLERCELILKRFRKRWHAQWVPREQNVAADELSNRGMRAGTTPEPTQFADEAHDSLDTERMWRTVGQAYLLGHHTPECFGLLCDLERVLHGETPLRWELVPRYRVVMDELAYGSSR